MNRRFLVVVFALLTLGCSGSVALCNYRDKTNIDIRVVEKFDYRWVETGVNITEHMILEEVRPIESSQDAINRAQSIISYLHERGQYLDYSLVSLVHAEKDCLWCFEYSIDQHSKKNSEVYMGGGLSVLMNEITGDLIAAWIEE